MMIMFFTGVVAASAFWFWRMRRQEQEFRNTFKAIYEGWAEPDENGYIGWGRPINLKRRASW